MFSVNICVLLELFLLLTSFSDPHSLHADSDPLKSFNADPDPSNQYRKVSQILNAFLNFEDCRIRLFFALV